MNERTRQQRMIHRLAIATAVVSLAPIGIGSLVTTLGAGMAFPDWPTSDGAGMLSYPWLASSGDKFVEHGHRLAGMLIGFCSIGLCFAAWFLKARRSVRLACLLVLCGVIVQGLLGGLRVRLDARTVAFGHSVFGCVVFVALWMVASMTGRNWQNGESRQVSRTAATLAVVFPILCLSQYVLGGFIRHLGQMLHAHVLGAILVLVLTIIAFVVSTRSQVSELRRKSWMISAAVLVQIVIGVLVWATKFGFPPLGILAYQHSLPQVASRTLHTVSGMLVVATVVSWSVSVLRSLWNEKQNHLIDPSAAIA